MTYQTCDLKHAMTFLWLYKHVLKVKMKILKLNCLQIWEGEIFFGTNKWGKSVMLNGTYEVIVNKRGLTFRIEEMWSMSFLDFVCPMDHGTTIAYL